MATTFTNSVACINTAGSHFYIWANPIAAFMSSCGWLQQNDTGQVAWPISVFNITDALENAGNTSATFTGTIIAGVTPLVIGQSITVTGTVLFGTVAAPTTYTITGGNLTTTFTAAASVGANTHETPAANTAWGGVSTVFINPFTTLSVTSNVITFNYLAGSVLQGALRVGQSVVVKGTSGATFDATYVVTGGALTTNFTAAIVHADVGSTACASATGTVLSTKLAIAASAATNTTLPPAASNSVYEIWKMGDSNTFPVFLRINYGASATPSPLMTVVLSAGTDGAGTATGGTSGTLNVFISSGTVTAQNSYMSGNTNRLQLALWPIGTGVTVPGGFINIERSHDSSGNDTTSGQYATINIAGNTSANDTQVSITALNQTVTETRWACLSNHTTATGSFGFSTILSPVFPIVGAIGNPMIGLQVGKFVDWANATQFSFTMYNVSHNYIIFVNNVANNWGGAGGLTYDATPNCAIAIRYE